MVYQTMFHLALYFLLPPLALAARWRGIFAAWPRQGRRTGQTRVAVASRDGRRRSGGSSAWSSERRLCSVTSCCCARVQLQAGVMEKAARVVTSCTKVWRTLQHRQAL